jgi:hypothetical protein
MSRDDRHRYGIGAGSSREPSSVSAEEHEGGHGAAHHGVAFPPAILEDFAKTVHDFFVFEMSAGQMIEDVRLALAERADPFLRQARRDHPDTCRALPHHRASLLHGSQKERAMKKVYTRPKTMKQAHFHYCPGCGHGIINRLLMEVVDEMGLKESAICVAPAGAECSFTTIST